MVEKYLNVEGQVAVLVSPEYGSGWSTWNIDKVQLVFEPVVVQWVLDGKPDADRQRVVKYLEETYPDIYIGSGLDSLEVQWLVPKTKFRIAEHDGYEELAFPLDEDWLMA